MNKIQSQATILTQENSKNNNKDRRQKQKT